MDGWTDGWRDVFLHLRSFHALIAPWKCSCVRHFLCPHSILFLPSDRHGPFSLSYPLCVVWLPGCVVVYLFLDAEWRSTRTPPRHITAHEHTLPLCLSVCLSVCYGQRVCLCCCAGPPSSFSPPLSVVVYIRAVDIRVFSAQWVVFFDASLSACLSVYLVALFRFDCYLCMPCLPCWDRQVDAFIHSCDAPRQRTTLLRKAIFRWLPAAV